MNGCGTGRNAWWCSAGVVPLLCVLALAAGCSEGRAGRAFRAATEDAQNRPSAEVRTELQRVIERWPHTRAADLARREIEWMDDLEKSSFNGRALLAWDAVRRVGQAVERYRMRRGRYPERYADLVPLWLPGPIDDPWGQPIGYLRTPRGYQVVCFGSDGIPGGQGDATDVIVENGRAIRRGR